MNKINEKRKELEKSIIDNGINSEVTQKISVELDLLIMEYYKKSQKNQEKVIY